VEQTEVNARIGAPRSRLHARGQVTSRGTTRLVMRFDGEDQTVSIRPHLVRVLPAEAEMPSLSVEHIIEQSRGLLPATEQVMIKPIEPPVCTGDPWIDAYLRFRQAYLDGVTSDELTDFAHELKRALPGPTPLPPAAMFIHADIIITCGTEDVATHLGGELLVQVEHCAVGAALAVGDSRLKMTRCRGRVANPAWSSAGPQCRRRIFSSAACTSRALGPRL
jgi:hypothetical protein